MAFSTKRIAEHLRVPDETAREIRAILQLDLIEGVRTAREETSPEYELWHDAPTRKLRMVNRLAAGYHGVEIIRSRNDSMHRFRGLSYLNSGDTYGNTLLYDHGREIWRLTTWGDEVERAPRRFE